MAVGSMEQVIARIGVSRYAPFALFVAVASGLGVSVALFLAIRTWDQSLFQSAFDRQCQQTVSSLKQGIDTHLSILRSLRALYESSQEVTRKEFSLFVRDFLMRYPGVQAIEWIPRVPNAQRDMYEKSAQREGFPNFQITERNDRGALVRDAERQEYYPVYYVTPYAGNEVALGFDLASDPVRQQALFLCRDTGQLTATPPIALIQERRGKQGLLAFLPVYRKGAAADSLESRRENIEGFYGMVFRISDFLSSILQEQGFSGIDLYVFDESARQPHKLLFFRSFPEEAGSVTEPRQKAEVMAGLHYARRLAVGGREWSVLLAPTGTLTATSRTWIPWAALVSGLVFTALMTVYLVQVLRGAEQARSYLIEQASARQALEQEMARREAIDQALRESEKRYRTLFESATEAIFILEADGPDAGRIAAVNKAAAEIHGYTVEELLTLNIKDLDTPESAKGIPLRIERLLRGEHLMEEVTHRKKDGTVFPMEINARMIELDGRNYLLAMDRDISERKAQEAALRQRDSQQRALLDNIPDIAWLKDEESRFIAVNESFGKACGRKADELPGKTDFEVWPLELALRYRADDREVMASGMRKRVEEPLADQEGQIQWIETIKTPIGDDSGNVIGTAGIARDITERKRAEVALQESEERFSKAFRNNPAWLAIVNMETLETVEVNDAWTRTFGYSIDEAIGRTTVELGIYDEETLNKIMEEATAKGSVRNAEVAIRTRTGENRVLLVSREVVGIGGKPHLLAMGLDITDRKRTEEALRESEQRFRAIFDSEHAVMLIVDPESGAIEDGSPGACNFYGYDREDLKHRNISDINTLSREETLKKMQLATSRQSKYFEFQHRLASGELRDVEVCSGPIVVGDRTLLLSVINDVTGRKSLEKQLLQAQKMEAVGALAGGIAHDFNNLLTVISGYSELLLMDQEEGAPGLAELRIIRQTVQRGADLVKQILAFGRKLEASLRPIDLNHEVRQAQNLLSRSIPKMVNIELREAAKVHTVNADPGQIEQILLNLALNAKDAIPETGGRIVIETKNVFLDKTYCDMNSEAKPGNYVLLSVSDTGHGMKQEVLDRIFEPFFTTKAPGKGTGLGLAMVFGIVKSHGGHVACSSEPGIGTTFNLYFPAILVEDEPDVATTQEIPAYGTESILLVDDEEFLRDVGSRILSSAGYTVMTAASGYEALEVYRDNTDRIDMVILDLIMPEMGGKECLEKLLVIAPKVKVLITSGYSADRVAMEPTEIGARGFVGKPYNMKRLLQVVREVLDAP